MRGDATDASQASAHELLELVLLLVLPLVLVLRLVLLLLLLLVLVLLFVLVLELSLVLVSWASAGARKVAPLNSPAKSVTCSFRVVISLLRSQAELDADLARGRPAELLSPVWCSAVVPLPPPGRC